jgi:hypothetical protein
MAVLSSLFGRREVAPAVGAQMISATELPPELRPYYKDILSKAQALYQDKTAEGYKPYTGPTLAEFTPEQQQVQTGIAGLVGSGEPVYEEAMGLARQTATPFSTEQIESYMSPYQQAVTDIEKREAQKQYETQVLPELAAKAAQAQAFGGSRQAILEGMAADTQQRLLADIQTKGSAQAYQDAVNRLQADRTATGQAATDLANLGAARYKQATTELSGLQAVGQEKQRQAQTALNEAFQQYLEEQQFPYDTMSKYQSVVTGAPIRPMQYVEPQEAQYAPSLGQQLIGGLGGLGNIYGAFTGRTIGGQPYQQPAKTGGGIGTLIKRANGGGDLKNEIEDIKSTFQIDESLFPKNSNNTFQPVRNADGSINPILTQSAMIEPYLNIINQYQKGREETKSLSKKDLELSKSQLEADKANQQFNREQAAFTAMAGLLDDQDVTDAPGGGVGQVLTMLAKAGPKIGAAEMEQRAKIKQGESDLSKLQLQYQQALNEGDLESATKIMTLMDSLSKTQVSLLAAQDTPTYKAGMGFDKYSELAKQLFPGTFNTDTNQWIMPDKYVKDHTNVMTGLTKFVSGLQFKPKMTLNIGGKTITIDVAKDLLNQDGSITLSQLGLDEKPEMNNRLTTQLLYLIHEKLGYDSNTEKSFIEKVSEINTIDPPGPELDAEEKSSFTKNW